jgi:hypothetical protein
VSFKLRDLYKKRDGIITSIGAIIKKNIGKIPPFVNIPAYSSGNFIIQLNAFPGCVNKFSKVLRPVNIKIHRP